MASAYRPNALKRDVESIRQLTGSQARFPYQLHLSSCQFDIGRAPLPKSSAVGMKHVARSGDELQILQSAIFLDAIAVIDLQSWRDCAEKGNCHKSMEHHQSSLASNTEPNLNVTATVSAATRNMAYWPTLHRAVASQSAQIRYAVATFVTDHWSPLFKEAKLFLHRKAPFGAMRQAAQSGAAALVYHA